MTPKDQAKAIVNEFYFALPNNGYLNIGKNNCSQRWTEAIKCALICVNRIINANGLHPNDTDYDYNKAEIYWGKVIEEIKIMEIEK
jgi:hypothetical protein